MRRLALAVTVGAALTTAALSVPSASASPAARSGHGSERTCPAAPVGYAACHARVVTDSTGAPLATSTPAGYGPADLWSAYKLPGLSSTSTATVAIVDAYDDPTAASDLATYRSQYGLPACGAGCFTKVNQNGGTTMPRKDAGWATEISLDLDMASAICPSCKILLVEASSSSFTNLGAAVNYAASVPGVVAISNSYGGTDSSNIAAYENAAARGIAVTASTGDSGYQVQAPASFTHVVAVGGTHLVKASNTRGWTESAWSGAGSGCSTINAQPGWQTGTQCAKKANADVSAIADPNTGVAVYDSTPYQGRSGWQVYGGTSVASPIIGTLYALANNLNGGQAGQYTWSHSSSLFDATGGSNGTCSPSLWCTGVTGWDGPTGLGTPNGTGAF